jgi:hypothetical protein
MIYDSFWRLDIVAQTNENSRFEPENPGGNVGRAPENAGTLIDSRGSRRLSEKRTRVPNGRRFLDAAAELAQLLEAFGQATEGNRRLIFLNGERRTRKTVLLKRFLTEIGRHEFTLLRARCVPLNGAAEPFLPLLEALERRCREPRGKPLIEFYINLLQPGCNR